MPSAYDRLHSALTASQNLTRAEAEAFHAAIAKHKTAGGISAKEAGILHGMNWTAALDPFAASDPEWLNSLRPTHWR
ncbi:hypothetical protein OHA44_17110 [Streptomyces sp. NBC_00144]|uniref:hypothetical protein n=1 Tax=Streptomyces sp. NBC_00144 TaxID=2975665 RepID=UPI0032547790